jgi:hypothetical protein
MANDISAGQTFVDGQSVNAARLNSHVNDSTILPGFISGKTEQTPLAATDSVPYYSSAGSNILRITGAHLKDSLFALYYTYQTVGDTNYTVQTTDRVIATSAVFTAARTFTLPSASSFGAGQSLLITDLAGGVTPVNYLQLLRSGADTIEPGALTFYNFTRQGGTIQITSNGVTKWAITEPQNKLVARNSSTTNLTVGAVDIYIAGSSCVIPAGYWTIGSQYYCKFDMAKTAAGTAGPIIAVRCGTLGTTGDIIISTITFTAGTAIVDSGVFEVWVNFRTIGSGTSATIMADGICNHISPTGGLTNASSSAYIVGANVAFDSTTPTTIGLSFNPGASFSGTCRNVQAEYKQI